MNVTVAEGIWWMMMRYNLGNYRYDSNGKIYKKVWWFIYKCIDKGPYNYLQGVKVVNEKCHLNNYFKTVWRM